jgi:hypothetical protein
MRLTLVCLIALAFLAGCGEDDAQPAALAELVVFVDRDGARGPDPAQETHVRCEAADDSQACGAAAALREDDFAPVPGNVACTGVYGGPETARVTGTLRGESIDARFSRTNGCEISRWAEVAGLLGAAGR